MRERGTRYPRIKRNWQVVGSNLHTSQPKLFLHAAARSFSIYYRGNESRELLDFCPTPPMKFTPACFHPASSFSFQRSNPRKIRLSSITIRKYCGGPRGVSRFALSGFAAFFFFLHSEETFQRYDKIWFLFLASFIVNCEWNFFVSSRDEKYRWIWKRILNDGVWRC